MMKKILFVKNIKILEMKLLSIKLLKLLKKCSKDIEDPKKSWKIIKVMKIHLKSPSLLELNISKISSNVRDHLLDY